MTTETRHAGLTADERSDIRSTVLETRELIEEDIYRQLERYGVYEDERVDLDQLGHLSPADKEIRRTIDAAINRELEATGGIYQRSVRNYVREATKTELNRLVALKAIEVRGLVSETLTERPEYGNRSELVRAVDEVASQLTDCPDGGMGTALSMAFTELSNEIGVIFEESEHTAIDVDFAVRNEVIDALNGLDQTIWKSDEAMGWVYQYFGEQERSEIDERIDEENYKVQDTDVATKTQLFTPRYIVEWMVDNSLGRLWLEMHGETTSIDDEDKCFYLAPLEDALIDRPQKDVRDIKVLDPACGSGHMLFYAFDVLYEMYLEQGDVPEKYIPREILKNNLYGIDIDPGAAQLAALALYVKAKDKEPDVEIQRINIVSADAVLVNGEKKEEVLASAKTGLEGRVLEQVWRSFEHLREWGTLVRIEERIEDIIEEERDEIEELHAQGQARFTGEGDMTAQSSFISGGEEVSWDHLKDRLLERVSTLAEEALEQNNPVEEMFAGEVEKSVQLLDLFIEKYEVVISNPPYLDSGKIDKRLNGYIQDNFVGSRDLYSAFIERCTEMADDDNYIAVVTPENFMFLSSFQNFRELLLNEYQIIEGKHLSRYGFDQAKDSFTIPFVLRNRRPEGFTTSRFYRMTHKQEEYAHYEDKILGLSNITESLRDKQGHKDIYVINQNTIREIRGAPIVYWFGQEIISLFDRGVPLDEAVFSQSGIKSGKNKKFLRKCWEVSQSSINERYKPLIRSEESLKYNDQTTFLIDWKNDGEYIQTYGDKHGHQYFFGDEERLNEECVSFKKTSRTNFTARHVGENDLVDNQMYTIHPKQTSPLYINGFLNSSLVQYIIDGLNPTANVQQGDVIRVPYIHPQNTQNKVEELTKKAIERISDKVSLFEIALEFDPDRYVRHASTQDFALQEEMMIDCDIYTLNGLIDKLIFEEYGLSDSAQSDVYDNTSANLTLYPAITNVGGLDASEFSFRSEVPTKTLSDGEFQKLINQIDELKEHTLREISEELEISPYTIAKVRHNHDLYTLDNKQEAAGRLLSYYLGCAMGRWELEDLSPDENGIIVFDRDFEDNVMSYMRRCIELTYGQDEVYERETEIEEMLNKNIEDWLRNTFFRYHHCKEYRRRGQRIPIYWQLASDEGAFSCYIYYHSMDGETFPKLRGQYIDQKIDTLQNRLDAIDAELDMADGDRARELRSDREEVQADIDDIREFRERVDSLIEEGFSPDFEAGIWENIQKVDEHDLLAVPLDKL